MSSVLVLLRGQCKKRLLVSSEGLILAVTVRCLTKCVRGHVTSAWCGAGYVPPVVRRKRMIEAVFREFARSGASVC